MRTTIVLATFLCMASPVAAQHDHGAPAASANHKLPDGWSGRTDRANQAISGVMVMPMGTGVHLKTGPAAILWRDDNRASGNFRASATFSGT